MRMFDNSEILLQDVRYVLEYKKNLFSISMFDGSGYSTKIEYGMMKISNGALIVAKGTKISGLYILNGYIVIAHASIIMALKVRHASENGLMELGKENLLNDNKLEKLYFCDHCILGKNGFFKGKNSWKGSYFLTIIDDFSRRIWISILKDKSETFQKFKRMKLIKNQGLPKSLRGKATNIVVYLIYRSSLDLNFKQFKKDVESKQRQNLLQVAKEMESLNKKDRLGSSWIHAKIKVSWMQESMSMVQDFLLNLNKIALEDNLANVFTKSFSTSKFKYCLDLINFV
uniref:Retrovirus-related Pol polyprotein from transposon TNT 1-94 n=1 Tax=Cajanus cajan TaxID=3821 RepID=A0A151SYT1_CAJCA|nr:Retrovirus-related Pol polyprotein from transposon TNT 1-94 [Cajanus cajan]